MRQNPMTNIDTALNHYEEAARRRKYIIAPPYKYKEFHFDEAAAHTIFRKYQAKENAEYFSMLRRWNGMHLESRMADESIHETRAGLD